MGLRGWIGGARGSQGVLGGREGIQGIPWGHRVGLMSLLMIHKAYMPVYSDPDFSCTRTGRTGRDQPKVVQEVLADLKRVCPLFVISSTSEEVVFRNLKLSIITISLMIYEMSQGREWRRKWGG